jgi:nitrate/TMAO reductase-like tetraheme cytochrome c subunit
MKKHIKFVVASAAVAVMAAAPLMFSVVAADSKTDPIEEVMKTYHKAPKGVDPVCKKAVDGKASPDELKKLVAAYKTLAAAKPPKGDDASWKDKTTKLLAAAQSLEKGETGAAAKYKDAVNCKACHSVHKPD